MCKRFKRVLMFTGLLLFSLSTIPPFPFSPGVTAQSSELDELIKRVEARYGRMRGLAAEFEQTYTPPGGRERVRERGRLFLARPRRMRWEYEGKLFIVNGRAVWFYVPADREATLADAGSISDDRFPFLFLLGQTNLRRSFRTITLIERSSADGTRTLRLVPQINAGGIREIFMDVKSDGQIMKVKLMDWGGAVSEFSLENVRENYVAPDDAFDFRPPPGVTVRRQ